jgi:putative endonuclease
MLLNEKIKLIYVGVTSNLIGKIYQHQNQVVGSFSKKYNLQKLVYWEQTKAIYTAISREKQLKSWRKDWKLNLARTINLKLKDLAQFSSYLDPETSSG